jgi:hypothetical protein
MKRSYGVNCASSGVILMKIEATTARESSLSMTLAADVFQPGHSAQKKNVKIPNCLFTSQLFSPKHYQFQYT